MTFSELLQQSGMTIAKFSKYFNIPYRTVQSWNLGERQCPSYLMELIRYKLEKEGLIALCQQMSPNISKCH